MFLIASFLNIFGMYLVMDQPAIPIFTLDAQEADWLGTSAPVEVKWSHRKIFGINVSLKPLDCLMCQNYLKNVCNTSVVKEDFAPWSTGLNEGEQCLSEDEPEQRGEQMHE